MNEAKFVDFHTHLNWQTPLLVPENVLRIVSTPVTCKALPVPQNIIQTLELHPWEGVFLTDDFKQKAADVRFGGIGEVGLDRIKGKLPLEQQMEIFTQAAVLAQKLNKTLTIHCVKCFSELLAIYKKLRWQVPTVIHYFRGNLALAQQLWQHTDFILSLPPAINNQPQVLEFLRQNPQFLDRIVLETDDPDSGDIIQHYHRIAEQIAVKPEKLQKIMLEQLERLYHV